MSKTAPIKPFNGKPASSLQGTDISPAQAYKMTNYNERLDEILKQVSEAARQAIRDYRDHKEPAPQELTHLKAKQALTSLIKELVAEAKPEDYGYSHKGNELENYIPAKMYDNGISRFEQNLLKALEEV